MSTTRPKSQTEQHALRMAPDARRAHLLAIGAAAFGACAYEEVQIDQIAQQAGVSRGLLYHYFPGKRQFFAAIIQEGYDEILKVTQPDPALPPGVQLLVGLEAYLDHVLAHPHTYRALFRSAASAERSIQEVVQRNLDEQARRILAGLGRDAQADALGHLAVRSWLAFLVHAVLDWLDHPDKLGKAQLIELCLGALQGAVHAAAHAADKMQA